MSECTCDAVSYDDPCVPLPTSMTIDCACLSCGAKLHASFDLGNLADDAEIECGECGVVTVFHWRGYQPLCSEPCC